MDDAQASTGHTRRTFLIGGAALLTTACGGSDAVAPIVSPTTGATSPATAAAPIDSPTTAATDAVEAQQDNASAVNGGSDTTDSENAAENAAADADDDVVATPTAAIEVLTPALFEAAAVCTMLPTQGAGPFPSKELLDRRDITEGYPGHPLRLGIRIVDQRCQPIPGAGVDIWHTDATGDYSDYDDGGSGKDEGAGSTFCRGYQTADADGILEFQTIYPGWYEGRAVHIHVMAYVGNERVLTSQLYFDEAYTEQVCSSGVYAEFGPPDTPWARDGLIGDPTTDGTAITLTAAETSVGSGTLGLVTLGVDLT